AILLLALGSASLFLTAAAYWASTMDLASSYAGTVSGFMNMGGNLGGALSPTLTPFLAHRVGCQSALYVAAAVAVLGYLFGLGVHPERAIELAGSGTGETALTLRKQGVTGVAFS